MRRLLDEGPLARFSALVPGAAVGFVVIPRFALAVA